ncbi:hypothetical protein N7492_003391 [Penicillium capsulatum]|uniref:NAD-dependent epimerase/dehydratase domain-containing protein n=1 Tax=Penicillium capsulatum TaxID=69766 RepID=A0A9W9IQY7_9EURO|nr:hypothetical protein N7492_003391 [Penicillium capsulatum]
MATVLLFGAEGICGRAILDALIKDPTFAHIYVAPPFSHPHHKRKIQFVPLNFEDDQSTMVQNLDQVPKIDYIFYCAYRQGAGPSEVRRLNIKLMINFLVALNTFNHLRDLKRFILTQDFWKYGPYMGRMKQPCEETDPSVCDDLEGVSWPPSYHDVQQKLVKEAAARGGWEWVITYAHNVLGHAPNNFPNPALALGIYAATSKAMPGSELPFPGNMESYRNFNTWVSSRHLAKFCLWAATAAGAGEPGVQCHQRRRRTFSDLVA